MIHSLFYTRLIAMIHTFAMIYLGFKAFGPWTALIFSFGFVGGLAGWWFKDIGRAFESVRKPYWITLILFVLVHRVEENIFKFQEELSKITGNPVPSLSSPFLILLLALSVGSWVSAPFLARKKIRLGYYLLWSFFASMGITELAHFIFPFLVPGPIRYFPGMVSALALAPAAWWGMMRLMSRKTTRAQGS